MAYSLEYIHMNGLSDEPTFSIKELALNLAPSQNQDVICEGYGIMGMYKDDTGQLYIKMNDGNSLHYFEFIEAHRIS